MSQQTLIDGVFNDFLERIRMSGKLSENALRKLEEQLKARQLRPDQLASAIFAKDELP